MQSYNRWKAALRYSAWLAASAKKNGARIFIQNLAGMDCIWFLD